MFALNRDASSNSCEFSSDSRRIGFESDAIPLRVGQAHLIPRSHESWLEAGLPDKGATTDTRLQLPQLKHAASETDSNIKTTGRSIACLCQHILETALLCLRLPQLALNESSKIFPRGVLKFL